ncbi:transcriptional regulator (tetR-family) [Oceanobacillus iheyensis HTE831]|uniref:Transcriptional regulator (TetR-family) n=1 Tax=Oceanobacillus iheyensis (strain DSM 14371 / CIP 107618 / JCM 11309 / KCTC 3954 / HTE831) TaxID=221109 RepID=Q8ESJ8_OCEIH|nr:TetR/AcrR family transcriptional regulator [Oceanobacillus iheyensis]BAC12592.1 transcriptional regulator (tetR-family) [Oceanobacillus iheyensis HTE831]
MKENYTDLRIIRTQKAIRTAFVELIRDKGFDAVTVKEITNKAEINRGTFYVHYEDKHDLMIKSQEEVIEEMASLIKKNLPKIIDDFSHSGTTKIPFQLAVIIFQYINDNSNFIQAVLSPKGDLSFHSRLKEFIWGSIFNNNYNNIIDEDKTIVPGKYIVSYIASAHLGVIQEWIESGRKESPEHMAQVLSTITINGAYYAAGIKK